MNNNIQQFYTEKAKETAPETAPQIYTLEQLDNDNLNINRNKLYLTAFYRNQKK